MIKIAPSTLSADFRQLGQQVDAMVAAGADWVHFDCMDGHFVQNLTYGPLIVQAVRAVTDRPFDVHLMISNPEAQVELYAQAGADHILVQREVDPRPVRLLNRIRSLGKKAGIVYNPATPMDDLDVVLPAADIVMVMSVEPGAGGQEFMPSALPRIRRLRHFIDEHGLATLISVDGGVNSQTAPAVLEAGVDVIVTGSWFFHHPAGLSGAVSELRDLGARYRPDSPVGPCV